MSDLAQLLAEELDNECLGLDADQLEKAVAAALRAIEEHREAEHQEWVRRTFLGSASSIQQAEPRTQSWNDARRREWEAVQMIKRDHRA